MSQIEELLENLSARDKRYPEAAYLAILTAFLQLGKPAENAQPRQITASEFCEAVRRHFTMFHGDEALQTMREWNIHTSDDVGEIVFNLAEINVVKLSEGDSREDYTNIFDFESEIQKHRPLPGGVWWGVGVILLALPALVWTGHKLWSSMKR